MYLHPVDPQPVVHDRPRIIARPHPAGASVVVQRVGEVSDGTLPVLVAVAEETNIAFTEYTDTGREKHK